MAGYRVRRPQRQQRGNNWTGVRVYQVEAKKRAF